MGTELMVFEAMMIALKIPYERKEYTAAISIILTVDGEKVHGDRNGFTEFKFDIETEKLIFTGIYPGRIEND